MDLHSSLLCQNVFWVVPRCPVQSCWVIVCKPGGVVFLLELLPSWDRISIVVWNRSIESRLVTSAQCEKRAIKDDMRSGGATEMRCWHASRAPDRWTSDPRTSEGSAKEPRVRSCRRRSCRGRSAVRRRIPAALMVSRQTRNLWGFPGFVRS